MQQIQTLKTVIHEIAHQRLHSGDDTDLEKNKTRGNREVEAESVAYTVCQHYGIDTSDYSFTYIAAWSQGKEISELKESLDTIRKTASEFINKIDGYLAGKEREMIKERVPDLEKSSVLNRLHINHATVRAKASDVSGQSITAKRELER